MSPDEEITICAKCKHGCGHGDAWYNWICMHPELERPLGVDPVTGKQTYWAKNDLNMIVTTDQKNPYCRDINHGYCDHYELKMTEKVKEKVKKVLK